MRFIDQIGHEIAMEHPPRRILSLVPSQTELLVDLGLNKHLAGITKFCIDPTHLRSEKVIVGGTKALHFDRIASLKPDLIIANKEENRKEDILALQSDYPVWTSDIKTLDDAAQMIESIGTICGAQSKANELIDEIRSAFEALSPRVLPLRALYLIWKAPYMSVGHDTFIHHLLPFAGFENVLNADAGRYPELTSDAIRSLNPDVLLLSSEPFPFQGKHTEAVRSEFPELRIMEVDGEMFSWYGSRLKQAPAYFDNLMRTVEKE